MTSQAPIRSGTLAEQQMADSAIAMAASQVQELGGTFTPDGHSGPGTLGAWSYGIALIRGRSVRLAGSAGGVVQVDRSPFDHLGHVITTAQQVRTALAQPPRKTC